MRRRPKPKPYRPIDREKFRYTRYLARLTQEEVACLLHVTARTVAHWETGKTAIPYAAYKLLRILTGYELPGETWRGWSIREDKLWSPEGRGYSAGFLGYNWLVYAMAERWRQMVLRRPVSMPEARKRAGRLQAVQGSRSGTA